MVADTNIQEREQCFPFLIVFVAVSGDKESRGKENEKKTSSRKRN